MLASVTDIGVNAGVPGGCDEADGRHVDSIRQLMGALLKIKKKKDL